MEYIAHTQLEYFFIWTIFFIQNVPYVVWLFSILNRLTNENFYLDSLSTDVVIWRSHLMHFLFGIRKNTEKVLKSVLNKKNIKRPQYFDCAELACMLESENECSTPKMLYLWIFISLCTVFIRSSCASYI